MVTMKKSVEQKILCKKSIDIFIEMRAELFKNILSIV